MLLMEITTNLLTEPEIGYNENRIDKTPHFIDPLDEKNFKHIFEAEERQGVTMAFLNQVLRGKRKIQSFDILEDDNPNKTRKNGVVVIDIICQDQNGAFFVVELQKNRCSSYKNHSLFNGSSLIAEQGPLDNRRSWNYGLMNVYVITIIEKFWAGNPNTDQWLHDVALIDTSTGKVFNKGLHFTYVVLSNFKKSKWELKNELEKWIYALKKLKHLKRIPTVFNETELLQFCEASRAN